jgi:hypothetical protein
MNQNEVVFRFAQVFLERPVLTLIIEIWLILSVLACPVLLYFSLVELKRISDDLRRGLMDIRFSQERSRSKD